MNQVAKTRVGLFLAGIALICSFCLDLKNTSESGAQALRNRIIGARAMTQKLDPYHYRWQAGDPVGLYDPIEATVPSLSRVTVTPAMLLLHVPLTSLPYSTIRYVWLVIQWLLLLGTGYLWWRHLSTLIQRAWWIFFLVGFTYTAVWRLHAERGQAYVLLLCLFSYWLSGTLAGERRMDFWIGLAGGLLIALRPPCVILLPFLALHRRGQWLGTLVGMATFFFLPLAFNTGCWSHYFSAMGQHSSLYLHDNVPPVVVHTQLADVEGVPASVMAHPSSIVFTTFSAYRLLRHFGAPVLSGSVLLAGILVPFFFWLWLSRGRSMLTLMTGMAAWFFLFDFFLPADRISYNDVIILALMGTGLIGASRLTLPNWINLAAMIMSWGVLLWPHAILRELPNLPVLCWVTAACATFLVHFWKTTDSSLQPSTTVS